MKTLGRIVIILVAALVVAGATVAFSQSTLASSMFARGGRAGFEGRRAVERQLPAGQLPGNFERRGGGDEMGGINLFSVGPIVKDLAIMGSITILVVIVSVALSAGKRSKQTRQPPAAGQVANQQGLS